MQLKERGGERNRRRNTGEYIALGLWTINFHSDCSGGLAIERGSHPVTAAERVLSPSTSVDSLSA
jgi:hypothetical protein